MRKKKRKKKKKKKKKGEGKIQKKRKEKETRYYRNLITVESKRIQVRGQKHREMI